MGENLDAAQAIHTLCIEKELTAAVNFQMRYAPFVIAARDIIEHGLIGELTDIEVRVTVETPWHLWDFLNDVPFAEILYHSIHYLDLIRSFAGEPDAVYAQTVTHPRAPEMDGSSTNIILDYGNRLRAVISTNHHHVFGLKHQESYVKWEGTHGAIKATMGLLMNYPEGEPDRFEFCRLEDGQTPIWQSLAIEGSWFPDAFIGSMASLMRSVEGSSDRLPTAVDDAWQTMKLVDAVCRSCRAGATPVP